MRILIIGCGQIGQRLGERLFQDGHEVIGVRRSLDEWSAQWPCLAADASSEGGVQKIQAQMPKPELIYVTANPGLRGGGDNHILCLAELLCAAYTSVPIIYTSSTAVYADAPGQVMNESGTVDTDERAQHLLSIEEEFLRHDAVILRLAALVGPERMHIRKRIMSADAVLKVRGRLQRRFNFVHDYDAVAVLYRCVDKMLAAGVYNICSDMPLTAEEYFRLLIGESGQALKLEEQEPYMPDRVVDNARYMTHEPSFKWRQPLDRS